MSEQTNNAVEKQAEDKGYTFSRPFKFEGEPVESLTLDFDSLSGDDILSVNRQYQAESNQPAGWSLEMDKEYQAYIVAKAAGVHVGLIKAAPAKDFTKLTLRARNFLLL